MHPARTGGLAIHVAYKMASNEYDDRLQPIQSLGSDVREGRSRVESGGHSICFHDFDSHMFEVRRGTLQERLHRYVEA